MSVPQTHRLLEAVRSGETSIDSAIEEYHRLPFENVEMVQKAG